MDLLKIYEDNKKQKEELENQEEEIKFKRTLQSVLASIVAGNETYKTEYKEFIDKLNIKYKKITTQCWGGENLKYEFNLNKTNIQKIQKYIDKENAND